MVKSRKNAIWTNRPSDAEVNVMAFVVVLDLHDRRIEAQEVRMFHDVNECERIQNGRDRTLNE
jgi:hypothetical protein